MRHFYFCGVDSLTAAQPLSRVRPTEAQHPDSKTLAVGSCAAPTSIKFLYCLAVICCQVAAGQFASAQGLLGKQYFSIGYEAQRPKSDFLRDISSWSHGVSVQFNRPLTETLDWHSRFMTQSFSGDLNVSGVPLEADADLLQIDTNITKHFRPFDYVDPYVSLGIGYIDSSVEMASSTLTVVSVNNDFGIGWRAGIEWRFTDHMALQTEIFSGETFDDLDVDDLFLEDLFFEARMIRWWNERLLSGFTIGSDFDDIDVALGIFIGSGF